MTPLNAITCKRKRVQRGLSPENMAAEIGVPVEDLLQFEAEGHEDGGPLEASAQKVMLFYNYFGGSDVRTGPTS